MKASILGLDSRASVLRRVWGRLISWQFFGVFALTPILILPFGASRANADVVDYIYQSGSNVISAYSGTIDTAALVPDGTSFCGAVIIPASAAECFDEGGPTLQRFTEFTGPASFGPGIGAEASSQSGNPFAINGSLDFLDVYVGYVSGTAISGSMTWDGTTIPGLGLTPGTYTYTWGAGATDSFVVDVGVAPVPEPASLGLMSLVVLTLLVRLRGRRESNLRRAGRARAQ